MLLRDVEAPGYDCMVDHVLCVVPHICHQPLTSATRASPTSQTYHLYSTNPDSTPVLYTVPQMPERLAKCERPREIAICLPCF
ncbi:hypothetical protein GT037_003939 [Alternaria burnsii]|uniref:Uncharacterized protein n=1 Tax=Alternaria burnsii TaxID=1187904 RepID=A0A8H7BC50_9PLEO|nr:uncharacterized protein GT037_003939 [Alternaria burnsii]KAF7678558.1 hypothetical protein GT037_003939 [Alternaria burnsii]